MLLLLRYSASASINNSYPVGRYSVTLEERIWNPKKWRVSKQELIGGVSYKLDSKYKRITVTSRSVFIFRFFIYLLSIDVCICVFLCHFSLYPYLTKHHPLIFLFLRHWFWRWYLAFVSLGVWMNNVAFWLVVCMIHSPVGVRALCGVSAFHPDKKIDPKTGEVVVNTIVEVSTVMSTVVSIWENVHKV